MEELGQIRNIGIAAHIDAGKTTTTERILYYAGEIHKMGDVDEGTTTTDYDAEEQQRGITIYSAAVSFEWRSFRCNLIDTPGHIDFTAEVERSLRVLDGAVVVFDAKEGVEAQSETVWRQADKYRVPRVCFLNKMDKTGADFFGSISAIRERLHGNPVAIQIPIGQEHDFRGVIDLCAMKAIVYRGGDGRDLDIVEIPAEMAAQAAEYRHVLEEQAAELDEDLMRKYVEGAPLDEPEIRAALRRGTITLRCQPTLCGSSLRYMGVQRLLDAVCDFLPSPLDVPPVEGHDPDKPDEIVRRACDPGGPLAALVFKIVADPHGDLHFVRVYSGALKAGSRVTNVGRRKKENVPRLFRVFAKKREPIDAILAGDIGAAIGLKETLTGDTLGDARGGIVLERIEFPETVISMAIEPKSSADRDKLAASLAMLSRSDPTFHFREDPETGQTIIDGMGELHLEVMCHRLERDFNVDVRVGKPRVAYRETVTRAAEGEGRFIRPLGGKPQFAVVRLRVEPFTPEPGQEYFQFVNALAGDPVARRSRDEAKGAGDKDRAPGNASGASLKSRDKGRSPRPGAARGADDEGDAPPIRPAFWPAIRSGIRAAATNGPLGSYPLINLRCTLVGGEEHPTDSSEAAFEAAAVMAFHDAVEAAAPALLEPIMKVEVVTPDEYFGTINGDLAARRAIITSACLRGASHVIDAEVPLSTMFGYPTQLRSNSQGRAAFSMEPLRYDRMPGELARKALGLS